MAGLLGNRGLAEFVAAVNRVFRLCFTFPSEPLFVWTGWTIAKCVVPVMATAWTLSLLGGLAQGGVVFAPEALIPKMSG